MYPTKPFKENKKLIAEAKRLGLENLGGHKFMFCGNFIDLTATAEDKVAESTLRQMDRNYKMKVDDFNCN